MLGKYYIYTYGCQMNIHESEKLAGMLVSLGYVESDSTDNADVIVFNTCCIRENAEQRVFGNIGALKSLKKKNPHLVIAVCGCMTQQEGKAEFLRSKFPFISIIFGTHNLSEFSSMLLQYREKKKRIFSISDADRYYGYNGPIHRTSGTNAWLNIIYGCNNFCTYCIVPHVRGREVSRLRTEIIEDAKRLISEGYREITLLGQNVDSYGNDVGDGYGFADLLRDLSSLDGDFKLRFMTSHPKDFSDKVIDVVANSKKICKSIHLPVQSGSTKILKKMNRKYSREDYLGIINRIRERIPECGITTDIMVGFPGETEEDFQETLSLVRECNFLSAFTFAYSPRNGTPAAKLEQIDEKVKSDRLTRLIQLQNELTSKLCEKYLGNTYLVLCEDYNEKTGSYCGRTDDGKLVNFKLHTNCIGKYLNVKIIGSKASVLYGEVNE